MIILHSEVNKSDNAYPNAIRKLRQMLDREEPELVSFLVSLWKHQENAISYAELKESVEAGKLDKGIYKKWTEDYASFIKNKMKPKWEQAIKEAADMTEKKAIRSFFSMQDTKIQEWLTRHSGMLITELSATQTEAMTALIKRAVYTNSTADTLAKAIRPTIGLYHGQATANFNYYQKVRDNLLKQHPKMKTGTAEKKAQELAIKYAQKQHRYRAMNIARTELATAYNMGEHFSIQQAQEVGYLGNMIKEVSTAGDRRVCKFCEGMEGMQIGMEESFKVTGKRKYVLVPPFHPGCRCIILYQEQGDTYGNISHSKNTGR